MALSVHQAPDEYCPTSATTVRHGRFLLNEAHQLDDTESDTFSVRVRRSLTFKAEDCKAQYHHLRAQVCLVKTFKKPKDRIEALRLLLRCTVFELPVYTTCCTLKAIISTGEEAYYSTKAHFDRSGPRHTPYPTACLQPECDICLGKSDASPPAYSA